jgi:excinuclease ABC subunit A
LSSLQPGTEFCLLAPLNRLGYKGDAQVLEGVREGSYNHVRIDGDMFDLSESDALPSLTKQDGHLIDLVVDRMVVPEDPTSAGRGAFLAGLMEAVTTALEEGKGSLIVLLDGEEFNLSEDNACPACEISLPKLEPALFNANSVLGMCSECDGLGFKLQVDPDLIITKPHKSLLDDASTFFHISNLRKSASPYWVSYLQSLAGHFNAHLEQPWDQLPEEFRRTILYGSEGKKIYLEYSIDDGAVEVKRERQITGAIQNINRLFRQTKSESMRRYYMQFMSRQPCPSCQGERLCLEARFVTLAGKRVSELASNSIDDLLAWVEGLPGRLDEDQRLIADELLGEIQQRLGFIKKVGLGYLTLDRAAPTLSGGEGQRIRLARQIGSGLVGMLYILDEPSIGLHPRDQRDLLHTLTQLRDIGNTVLVVEHDADTMRTSDYIIDLGPGAGVMGGELVAAGTPEEVMRVPESITGRYLSGELHITSPKETERTPTGWLTLKGARLHNLKRIDVRFPLGTFICVTGVSGSGKSSLVTQTLYPALARALQGGQDVPGPYDSIEGLEGLDRIIHITQAPIGRNPRSNPGTYVGVLPEIRKVYANTPDAQALGFPAGHFSFNVKGGRCEECQGYGARKVKLHFMADVWVRCKECEGRRFNQQTLDIRYKGRNIADVLDMDVQEALAFFSGHPPIDRILHTLDDVGLGYLKLGQSALTLSGGEAQRVKLAKELGRRATGKILYILDEPTVGLHFVDIQKLLDMLHRLVDAGNTVIVIEHNLDVINTADWIIDLGPEGGDAGGYLIAAGSPGVIIRVEDSFTGRFLKEVSAEKV